MGGFFFSVTRKNISVLHGSKRIIYPTLRKFEIVFHLSKAEIKTLFSTKNRWVPLDVIVILSFCSDLWISCNRHHLFSVLYAQSTPVHVETACTFEFMYVYLKFNGPFSRS